MKTHIQETVPSLAGTWVLVRWAIGYSDGRSPTLPFGEHPEGIIVYSGDGHMSAAIARANRAPLSGDSARAAPDAERLAAFDSYFHYAGRYEVTGPAGNRQVVHTVMQSLYPNFAGTRQVRDMLFCADGTLTLSERETIRGSDVARTHSLVWRRAHR